MRTFLFLLATAWAARLGAAGRPLTPPPPVEESPYYSSGVLTAFAGQRFLTIWSEGMRELGPVTRGAFSDANGRVVSERSFVLDVPGPGAWLDFTGTANGYVLFHSRGSETYMTSIDLQGRVTRTQVLALPRVFGWRFVPEDSGFLAVSRGQTSTVVYRFDSSGSSVRAPITLPSAPGGFDAVRTTNGFIVATSDTSALVVHTIRDDGSVTSRRIDDAAGSDPFRRDVLLAAGPDGRVMLLWLATMTSRRELSSQVIAPDGSAGEVHTVTFEDFLMPLELTRTGDGNVLTLTGFERGGDQSLWSSRIEDDGAISQPNRIAVLPASSFEIRAAAGGATTLVAYAGNSGKSTVESVAVDRSGALREGGTLSRMPRRQASPLLAPDESQILAAWTESSDERTLVRAASIALDGEPFAAANVIDGTLVGISRAPGRDMMLVLHAEQERLYASRVTRDGVNLDRGAPIELGYWPSGPRAGVTWARDRWLVTHLQYGEEMLELHLTIITADGSVTTNALDIQTPIEADQWRVPNWSALAFDGHDVLLVWAEHHNSFCPTRCDDRPMQTYAVRLAIDGRVLDAPVQLFDESIPPGSIATSGREFFVVLGSQARLLATRNGGLELIASRELFSWPVASSVTWDGSAYVVAMRYSHLQWDLAARRYNREANELGAVRGVQTLAADELTPPGIAAILTGNAVIAVHEGTAIEGMRAVLYREGDLAPLPEPPQPPRNVRMTRLSTYLYAVTWDEPAGPQPDGYVVEGYGATGGWGVVAKAGPDVRRVLVSSPPVRVRAINAGGASPLTELIGPSTTQKPRAIGH